MCVSKASNLHIAMLPWFAMGHMTPFLHLANKLAERGCKITFLLPNKAREKLEQFNHHPDSITLHPLAIPAVDGLPTGAETAADVPGDKVGLIMTAMDRSRHQVENVIRETMPALVMHDCVYWISQVTKPLGIKSMYYTVVPCPAIAFAFVPARNVGKDRPVTVEELQIPPAGYPSTKIVLRGYETGYFLSITKPFGENVTLYERMTISMKECDAIASRCSDMEAQFCYYLGSQYKKPAFVSGPVLPEPPKTLLEERWAKWLSSFEPGSVVFCSFGSENILSKEQFDELCLGFELTGLPFILALKPPRGASSVEEALPEGFEERVKGRGMVWGGWMQQVQILNHPSTGCFVSHCGYSSMWEFLLSDCQIVMVPHVGDQFLNARMMADVLEVGVEVERDEKGWFSKENLSKAIVSVMDKNSELTDRLKKNHAKVKDTLTTPGSMDRYIDNFLKNIQQLVN